VNFSDPLGLDPGGVLGTRLGFEGAILTGETPGVGNVGSVTVNENGTDFEIETGSSGGAGGAGGGGPAGGPNLGPEPPQEPVPQPHPSPTPTANSQNRGSFGKCFNGWRFSTAASQPFAGTRFHGAAKATFTFLEIAPPISLGGDVVATSMKATRTGIGGSPNPYASGLNLFFRHTADSSVKGSLLKFGTKATPIVSGIGAFTAGYNLSVGVQCGLGVIR
jgi:hypothetical protein